MQTSKIWGESGRRAWWRKGRDRAPGHHPVKASFAGERGGVPELQDGRAVGDQGVGGLERRPPCGTVEGGSDASVCRDTRSLTGLLGYGQTSQHTYVQVQEDRQEANKRAAGPLLAPPSLSPGDCLKGAFQGVEKNKKGPPYHRRSIAISNILATNIVEQVGLGGLIKHRKEITRTKIRHNLFEHQTQF